METITIGLLTCTGIGILMGFASAILFVSTTAKQRWWDAYRQGYRDAKGGREL